MIQEAYLQNWVHSEKKEGWRQQLKNELRQQWKTGWWHSVKRAEDNSEKQADDNSVKLETEAFTHGFEVKDTWN